MSKVTIENAPLFGGKPVHPDIVISLSAAVNQCRPLWNRVKAQGLVSQGWHKGVKASKGTHDTGHAIDILTRGLTDDEIRELLSSLNGHGFAAAFRPVGYDLGGGTINRTEHIHAAYRRRSNFWAVYRAIQPNGRAHVEKMLKMRGG